MKYLFLFLFAYSNAQITRYVYNFEYKRDSTSVNFNRQKTILEISELETTFFDYITYSTDSANLAGSRNSKMIPPVSINVYRKLGSKINKNYVFASSRYYQFESLDTIEWKLHDDLKTYNEWKLQKATCNYGGRNWIAWFNKDIPLPEGPYKFTGLPGLIFEIYDDKNNFRFSIREIYNIKEGKNWIPERIYGMNSLKITREKYNELLLNEYNNPFQEFRNMTGAWTLTVHGKTIKNAEGLNEVRREQQKFIRKYHNPIEINNAVRYE